jgi:hypothetical protein
MVIDQLLRVVTEPSTDDAFETLLAELSRPGPGAHDLHVDDDGRM